MNLSFRWRRPGLIAQPAGICQTPEGPAIPWMRRESMIELTSHTSSAASRRGRTARWPAALMWARLGGRRVGVYLRVGNSAWLLAKTTLETTARLELLPKHGEENIDG